MPDMPRFDIAVLADLGQRDAQEDSVAARYVETARAGYAIVADGMGGHDAGDVASDYVTSAWCQMVDTLLEDAQENRSALIDALPMSAMQANTEISDHVARSTQAIQMGSTMLGALWLDHELFWISIGDSPLYVYRQDQLVQLNDDHSMAPILEAQASNGEISQEEADSHPDRNLLRSVIMGSAIPKVDCPETPFEILPEDVLVVASDGLQYLKNSEIEAILHSNKSLPSQAVADALISAVHALNHPDQDNVSVVIVKPITPHTGQ